MNPILSFFTNPYVHGTLATLLGTAALIPGPWQPVCAILGPVFAGTTTVLPTQADKAVNAATAAVVATAPAVIATIPKQGSMHEEDYARAAAVIADALTKINQPAGRT